MPTNRFRSLPHPQDVLAYQLHLSPSTRTVALESDYVEPGWGEDFLLLAPWEDFPSFPSGVQYQGISQAAERPWRHYSAVAYLFGPSPGKDRTRHLFYEHTPGQQHADEYTAIKTSTDYSLSADGKLYVLLPIAYRGVYDFSKGQYAGPQGIVHSSPPGFPLSPYTQSYLGFPLYKGNTDGIGEHFYVVGKCTAGFTANFTQGNLGIWQSATTGHQWAIDDVTAFGYSDAVAIETATGVLGHWTPFQGLL